MTLSGPLLGRPRLMSWTLMRGAIALALRRAVGLAMRRAIGL